MKLKLALFSLYLCSDDSSIVAVDRNDNIYICALDRRAFSIIPKNQTKFSIVQTLIYNKLEYIYKNMRNNGCVHWCFVLTLCVQWDIRFSGSECAAQAPNRFQPFSSFFYLSHSHRPNAQRTHFCAHCEYYNVGI